MSINTRIMSLPKLDRQLCLCFLWCFQMCLSALGSDRDKDIADMIELNRKIFRTTKRPYGLEDDLTPFHHTGNHGVDAEVMLIVFIPLIAFLIGLGLKLCYECYKEEASNRSNERLQLHLPPPENGGPRGRTMGRTNPMFDFVTTEPTAPILPPNPSSDVPPTYAAIVIDDLSSDKPSSKKAFPEVILRAPLETPPPDYGTIPVFKKN